MGIRQAKYCLLLPLLMCIAVFSKAQEPMKLSLKDAVKYAVEANQNARKARLDLENSEYQIAEVRSRALPQLNGNAGLTYNPLLQKSAIPNIFAGRPDEIILVAFGQKWNGNAGVTLTQNLFDKSVFTGLQAAKAAREFYKISAELTEEQVIELVATNYYQLLVQRRQIAVLDTTIKNTQKVQNILETHYKNGLAKKVDVDRIAVNIANLQSQLQQLQNSVTLLENQLKYYMGLPIQTHIEVADVDVTSIEPNPVAIQGTVDIDGRTEIRLLNQQKRLQEYQKIAYKSEYYPSLSLSGNYSYQGLGNVMPVFKSLSDGVNWFDVASVSLNLRVPLFNGGATRSRIRQADISIRKINEDIENTSLALNLAYENAKTQINNSIIMLAAQKKNVQLAEEVFENTHNNYNQGLANLTDLLNAETSLTEANNNYSSALLNYRLAEIQLIKSKGELKSLLN